jgi:hypothetical protein
MCVLLMMIIRFVAATWLTVPLPVVKAKSPGAGIRMEIKPRACHPAAGLEIDFWPEPGHFAIPA